MRTTIEIKSITEKKAANGTMYHSVETDQGYMSCFEKEVMKKIAACFNNGKHCDVDAKKSGDWTNIRKFYDEEDPSKHEPADGYWDKPIARAKGGKNSWKDQVSIFISYAKDLAVAGKIDTNQIKYWVDEFINIYNEK